ncbi:MAG: helix-turn-helix transcriptional regulator [bacterium]
MSDMGILQNKFHYILKEQNLSYCKLAKLIDEYESSLISMIKGKRPFTEKTIKKILPILKVTKEEFESWIIADKYPKEILELAVQIKKNFPYKNKSILTNNIDCLLEKKEVSRTTLSKEINYSQSGLNQIITGKRTMSASILKKLSDFFEISQEQILSWIIADKYSLEILEQALLCTGNEYFN